MDYELYVGKKPIKRSRYKTESPLNLLTQGASSKTAVTYSPTVTQYHRRDEA